MAVNGIECKSYMSKERELTLFNPIRTSVPAHILPDSTNVVIIILESFGKEFVGSLSGKKSYSPFLDSMLNEYLSYQYAFANGKKSNEALPALLASIPTLMTKPIFRRPMPITKFCYPNLPKILSEVGYSSAFFHGATNGSMRFDSFAKTCGLDRYYGRKEYANDGHFDGVWAISDAYFNPWAAEQMSSLQPPFCSVLFTTSSHHPYHIPEEFEEQTISGPQKICVSISYADYALRLFFDKARNQPWFVADHSPASTTKRYNSRTEMYRIPLGFYHPQKHLIPEKRTEIAQQLDVYPTILDLLNVKKRYYSFGTSLLQNTERHAFTHLQGSYYYYHGEEMMTFSMEKAQNLLNFTRGRISVPDSLRFYPKKVRKNEDRLKAILQRYARDVSSRKKGVKNRQLLPTL